MFQKIYKVYTKCKDYFTSLIFNKKISDIPEGYPLRKEDNLIVLKRLNNGYSGVIFSVLNNEAVPKVIKIFKRNKVSLEQFENEVLIYERLLSFDSSIKIPAGFEKLTIKYGGKAYNAILMNKYPASVQDLLCHILDNDIDFDFRIAEKIMSSLTKTINMMHYANVIHSDIKPNNLLLTNSIENILAGRDFDVLICDFGLSVIHSVGAKMSYGGTTHYMAPELLLKENYDCRVDVWSLGCLYFELLTGYTLFDYDEHEGTKYCAESSSSESEDSDKCHCDNEDDHEHDHCNGADQCNHNSSNKSSSESSNSKESFNSARTSSSSCYNSSELFDYHMELINKISVYDGQVAPYVHNEDYEKVLDDTPIDFRKLIIYNSRTIDIKDQKYLDRAISYMVYALRYKAEQRATCQDLLNIVFNIY